MSDESSPAEFPVYRPFARLAFGVALVGGVPIGAWMLAWRYLGAPAVPVPWMLLHAHVQVFGFFGTLIAGVAPHLLARFAGRPLPARPAVRWLAVPLGLGLALRLAGTWTGTGAGEVLASVAQGLGFAGLATWVWSRLDASSLAAVRRHLTVSSAWFALACLLEAGVRARALWLGFPLPDVGMLRTVHAVGLLGGVLGWLLGVLLRAGPMFVAGWRVPGPMARAVPWLLAAGLLLVAAGDAGPWGPPLSGLLARAGEALALATVGAVLVTGGALRRERRGRRGLPLLSRGPEEARLFRLAAVAALAAAATGLLALGLAAAGAPAHLATDAARHLLVVGFVTAVVAAMAFRLVPVLEGRPLRWPRARGLAARALAASVVLRTLELLVPWGAPWLAPLVPLSGPLAWVAIGAAGSALVAPSARGGPRRRSIPC